MTILVCGYIGSGKSVFTKLLYEKLNSSDLVKENDTKVFIYNCDEIAKNLYLEKRFKKLLLRDSYFIGKDIFDGDYISTDKLKTYFFNNDFRHRFELIVHSIVFEYIACSIESTGENAINIVETALPSNIKYFDIDISVWVWRDFDLRYSSLRKERNYSLEKFEQIDNIQESYEKRYRKCDIILENNSTKEELEECFSRIKI